jgi:hypothetical protein
MWSRADVIGLFSINVVSFSRNVVLRDPLFSLNSVSNPRMLSVRTVYVLSSLQLAAMKAIQIEAFGNPAEVTGCLPVEKFPTCASGRKSGRVGDQ